MTQPSIITSAILYALLIASNPGKSQVIYSDLLEKDHSGNIISQYNYPEEEITHNWQYRGQSGAKTHYSLFIYRGDGIADSFQVTIRNLQITFYIAVKLESKYGTRTLTAVYDKGNKWMRVKFAAHEYCRRKGGTWRRLSNINSFDEILTNIILQMDENLILDCYLDKN